MGIARRIVNVASTAARSNRRRRLATAWLSALIVAVVFSNSPKGRLGAAPRAKIVAVSAAGHSLALDSTQRVWAWGNNAVGQLGDGTRTSRNKPVQVQSPQLMNPLAVVAGQGFSFALLADGTVWAWGGNDNGQLSTGESPSTIHVTPVRIPALTDVVAITSGSSPFALALKSNGLGLGDQHLRPAW
jgi:alpha-tubulin suppressor-like RCC1 family protein